MKPAVIAHRGASADAPENTLAAFRLAWEQDADAVEMDLWPTRDGRIAVIHDENLRRVAGTGRKVTSLDADELKQLDAGRWKGAPWTGERVPLLPEALALIPKHGRAFLELKGGAEMLSELKRCILESGLVESQICVIAFDRPLLAESKRLLPMVEHGWVLDWPSTVVFEQMAARAADDGLDALDFSASWPLDEIRVARVHQAGLKVYVWTVDDPDRARQLAQAGVDGITTNMPARIRQALA